MGRSRLFAALDASWPQVPDQDARDRLLALVDDAAPTAVEDTASGVRVFFSAEPDRDRALDLLRRDEPTLILAAVSVPDEAWAERSQAALTPVRIGRVVVTPPWHASDVGPAPDDLVITIVPSMGFGTGHHATTRLCLGLLQQCDLDGRTGLDVGTGSGVLALVMWRLGAGRVVAIDSDADAVASAVENVAQNQATEAVSVEIGDLAAPVELSDSGFDVVTANLTGALLQRFAATLAARVTPGGTLVVSGFQDDEETSVRDALVNAGLRVAGRAAEGGWLALRMDRASGV